ncbi:Hepatitis B virus X-interacting protein-like protein, partial [Stegodyphus mimosarum]
MEKNLHKVLDDVLNKPGVTGVLCADGNGLCLASRGVVDCSASGSLVHLMQLSSKLEPSKVPILRLQSDTKDILVQSEGGLTLAVVRNARK